MIVYGIAEDHYETLPSKVNALTLDQIQAAANETVKPDKMIWIVVGDKEKIAACVDELGFGEMKFMSPDGEVLE